MLLRSVDERIKYTRKIAGKDKAGNPFERVYAVGKDPVEIPDEDAVQVMNTWPNKIEEVKPIKAKK